MTEQDRNTANLEHPDAKLDSLQQHFGWRELGEAVAAGCGVVAALAEVGRVFFANPTLLAGISGAVIIIMILGLLLFINVQYASARSLIQTIVKLHRSLTSEKGEREVADSEHKQQMAAAATEIAELKRKLRASKAAKKEVAEFFNELTIARGEFDKVMQEAIATAAALREPPVAAE